jgi:hypothetical protein
MEETIHHTNALPAVGWRRLVLGAPAAWLVATAACFALALVILARPLSDGPSRPQLSRSAPASEIERTFSGIAPFTVQRNMGASDGKDATCSIYSDGNLDTGVRVTWAVTLCTVHAIGGGPAG